MKKLIFILMILLITLVSVSAQAPDPLLWNYQLLQKIGLEEAVITQLMQMQQTAYQKTRDLDLDYGIYQAQLKKMLAGENADKAEIKNQLELMQKNRNEAQWISVENRLDMKNKIGEQKYGEYLRARKRLSESGAGTQSRTRTNEPETGIAPNTDKGGNGTPGSGR
jgi:Spy/CpxP family protein refolding chaperone